MWIEKDNITEVNNIYFYFIAFIGKLASKTIMIAAID